jgi:hypothetical protein
MQNLSKFFVAVSLSALGACAAQSGAVNHGTGSGSGSDDGSDIDAGVGSGSNEGSAVPPPPPGTLYGSVFDERADTIDFSTGEPVHTHTGATIDLSQGCPVVYKYAYLEDQADPVFGSQTNVNPLEWHVTSQVGSLDDSATAYRVRLDNGTVALDWTTAAAPDDTGLYTVQLYRNGTPSVTQLGDNTGKMYIDMRFRDTSGNETVDTACWENHPMAAPLEVQPAVQSDLFGWTLPAHSPISTAINTASIDATAEEQIGASVYSQTIVQHTAEPVTLHLDHSAITAMASTTFHYADIATAETTVDEICNPNCVSDDIPPPTTTTAAGALTATWNMHVIDSATNAIVCHNPDGASPVSAIDGCVLPARAANAAPHSYQLVIAMSDAQSIDPDTTFTNVTSEESLTDTSGDLVQFTGSLGRGAFTCFAHTLPNGTEECLTRVDYAHIEVLDDATIAFDPLSMTVETAPDSTASLETIGSYATPSLSVAAQSWNAGSAGF